MTETKDRANFLAAKNVTQPGLAWRFGALVTGLQR